MPVYPGAYELPLFSLPVFPVSSERIDPSPDRTSRTYSHFLIDCRARAAS
ncbi:hypothetical protein [Pelotomaculum propionicicum]